MKTLLTEKELAARIHVPPSKLAKLRKYFDPPVHWIKGKAHYDEIEYMEWYEETIFPSEFYNFIYPVCKIFFIIVVFEPFF